MLTIAIRHFLMLVQRQQTAVQLDRRRRNRTNPRQGKPRAPTTNQATLPVTADPTTDADVPPVPKIPSTLNLPGTWPQDASREPSPVRPGVAPEKSDPIPESPKSRKVTTTTYSPTSTRERQSLRKTSRPTSRKGVPPLHSSPTKSLILGHYWRQSLQQGQQGKMEKESRVSRLIRPPY